VNAGLNRHAPNDLTYLRVFMMFEGNKNCAVCRKELTEKDRNFGISLAGYTHVFCESCFNTKKEQVKRVLHDQKY